MADQVDDDCARNYAALAPLCGEWARGQPGCYALVAAGAVQGVYGGAVAARDELRVQGGATVRHALVVALWPLDGWRHPRFVVESYLRIADQLSIAGAPRPDGDVDVPGGAAEVLGMSDLAEPVDQLVRDFLVAERLRGTAPAPEDLAAPYLLIKHGAVLTRQRRVSQARQVVDAAMPPLAPVVFTSLRPGRAAPFDVMVLQALLEPPHFRISPAGSISYS